MRHHHRGSRPHVQGSGKALRVRHSARNLTDGGGLVLVRKPFDRSALAGWIDGRAKKELTQLSAGETAVDDTGGDAPLWSLAVVAHQTGRPRPPPENFLSASSPPRRALNHAIPPPRARLSLHAKPIPKIASAMPAPVSPQPATTPVLGLPSPTQPPRNLTTPPPRRPFSPPGTKSAAKPAPMQDPGQLHRGLPQHPPDLLVAGLRGGPRGEVR